MTTGTTTKGALRLGEVGPYLDGTPGDVLTFGADGRTLEGQTPASAPVTSVFGRIGAVVAQLGDYVASLVNNDSGVAGVTVADALDTLGGLITALTATVNAKMFGYYFGANTGAIAADQYLGRWALGNVVTEANNQVPALRAGTLRNFRARTTAGNITVANCILTLRVNGVDTAITCTIVAGTASASDLTHSVVVAAGDLLSVRVNGNGTTFPGATWVSLEQS